MAGCMCKIASHHIRSCACAAQPLPIGFLPLTTCTGKSEQLSSEFHTKHSPQAFPVPCDLIDMCSYPCLQVIKPDVVLTSMEALAGDAAELQQISWDLIIMDERSRARGSVSKAHAALKDFPASSFRLLLSHGLPPQACHTQRLQCLNRNLVINLLASWSFGLFQACCRSLRS